MNEIWKEEMKKDMNKIEKNEKFLRLSEGLNSFVIDLSTKRKEVIEYEGKNNLYHTFNLVKNEYDFIKFTNFQYSKLLEQMKEVFKDRELCKYLEVVVEVKKNDDKSYKKNYYFKIKEMGDNLI